MDQTSAKSAAIRANYSKTTNPLHEGLIKGTDPLKTPNRRRVERGPSHRRFERAAPNGTAFRQTYRSASSAAMASKAAAGSSACVMGRPTTMWEAPLAKAWAGVATRL